MSDRIFYGEPLHTSPEMLCRRSLGRINRGVTLEVRKAGAIVQCRGYANRLPHANEVAMVKRWAREYTLTWQAFPR